MPRPTVHYSFLKIHSGSDLSKRRIPRMTLSSPESGPKIWLTGCMHGDEISGTVIIHELFRKLRTRLLCGTIEAFPLMNPSGFETVSRTLAISQEDLNRAFPGNAKGSLAERIAKRIFDQIIADPPHLAIDLHNDWNKSIPYVLLDPLERNQTDKQIAHFASKTGLLRIEDTDKIHSSLTYNLAKNHIPAMVLELGESYVINEKNIQVGFNAIWNILADLQMVEASETPFQYPLPQQAQHKVLSYYSLPLSSTSGIIRFLKKPGEIVFSGEKIATVVNAFGKQIEQIKAEKNAIVLGHADSALAFPGSSVMAFGLI